MPPGCASEHASGRRGCFDCSSSARPTEGSIRPWSVRRLRAAEAALPVSASVRELISSRSPDVVLVSPSLAWARAGGLPQGRPQSRYPVVLPVASWDNLTNKGRLRDVPDGTIVWNAIQVDEAVRLHHLPRAGVEATGAHAFDHWFSWKPSTTYEEFSAKVGMERGASDDPLRGLLDLRRKGRGQFRPRLGRRSADEPAPRASPLLGCRAAASPARRPMGRCRPRPRRCGLPAGWSRPDRRPGEGRLLRLPAPLFRGRRDQHERSDRGGDPPAAGAHVPRRALQDDSGGDPALRVPHRQRRRGRAHSRAILGRAPRPARRRQSPIPRPRRRASEAPAGLRASTGPRGARLRRGLLLAVERRGRRPRRSARGRPHQIHELPEAASPLARLALRMLSVDVPAGWMPSGPTARRLRVKLGAIAGRGQNP